MRDYQNKQTDEGDYYLSLFMEARGEEPKCAAKGCKEKALEVDLFYPYLDDDNRCAFHRHAQAQKLA